MGILRTFSWQGCGKATFRGPQRALRILVLGSILAPALATGSSGTAADTLDRVVAAVGHAAITASDVQDEYRLEVFLEQGRVPDASPDAATFERVRNRLVDQYLLMREAALEGAEQDDDSGQSKDELAALRHKCASEEAFQSALRSLGMDEQQLLKRVRDQDRALRLIDEHLRPQVKVEPGDIEAYYREKFLPEYAQSGRGSPPQLAEVESQIREILVQQEIDRLLPAWLENLRSSHRVRLID